MAVRAARRRLPASARSTSLEARLCAGCRLRRRDRRSRHVGVCIPGSWPELSRRFRALKIWFILKCHGARAITAAIDDNIAVAQTLAAAIDASPDFERLAPVPLSIVCFRHAPARLRGQRDALNAHNRTLMVDLQRDGQAYVSNATIGDDFALRACIVNYRTTAADAGVLLETIRRVAARSPARLRVP